MRLECPWYVKCGPIARILDKAAPTAHPAVHAPPARAGSAELFSNSAACEPSSRQRPQTQKTSLRYLLQAYFPTTRTVNEPGTILGRGRGCSGVARGGEAIFGTSSFDLGFIEDGT